MGRMSVSISHGRFAEPSVVVFVLSF